MDFDEEPPGYYQNAHKRYCNAVSAHDGTFALQLHVAMGYDIEQNG